MTREELREYVEEKRNLDVIPYHVYSALIDGIDTLEQEPQKGHWIYDKSIDNWRCSECNETPKTMGYVGTADFMTEHFKFCNHCGAKMGDPQESEDKENE